MSFAIKCAASGLLAGLLISGTAMAQETELGKEIYMDRCAVCHGETGLGDGLVGVLFDQKPKNLTMLTKTHDGAFPFSLAYQSIDGRRDIQSHGRSQMPVWGEYFMDDAIDDPSINEKNARHITEGRILSVLYYLQSIQSE